MLMKKYRYQADILKPVGFSDQHTKTEKHICYMSKKTTWDAETSS